jgi:hypothetical protein
MHAPILSSVFFFSFLFVSRVLWDCYTVCAKNERNLKFAFTVQYTVLLLVLLRLTQSTTVPQYCNVVDSFIQPIVYSTTVYCTILFTARSHRWRKSKDIFFILMLHFQNINLTNHKSQEQHQIVTAIFAALRLLPHIIHSIAEHHRRVLYHKSNQIKSNQIKSNQIK